MFGHNKRSRIPPALRADSLAVLYSIHATKGHTDGAFFPGKEQKFFTYRSHQRSGLIGEKKHLPALLELPTKEYPVALELILHSAIVTDFTMERHF